MFILLQNILVALISITTALLVSVGLIPQNAVAPDVRVPASLITGQYTKEVTNAIGTTTTAASEREVTKTSLDMDESSPELSTSPVSTPKPLIDDFDKSLKEALDALAQIEAEKKQATSVPTNINDVVRTAVVNILCTTAGTGALSPISASGVVIDPRGIVLTNAHVGQFFLLKDHPVKDFINCFIRTGSPATPTYTAELLFLPPSWIAKNAQKIDDEHPTGNGEHDYALLRITGTISGGSVSTIPYIPIFTGSVDTGDSVLLAAYPAGFLGGATINKELYAASANATVGKVYTYQTTSLDLFSIGGSIVAQQGSSGGAVAIENTQSPNGAALAGLIVTSSDAPDTASRDLRALATSYFLRDFALERGLSYDIFSTRDLADEARTFNLTTAPNLKAALTNVLNQ